MSSSKSQSTNTWKFLERNCAHVVCLGVEIQAYVESQKNKMYDLCEYVCHYTITKRRCWNDEDVTPSHGIDISSLIYSHFYAKREVVERLHLF